MSTPSPSGGQEQQNLTILENLRMKKMRMMQGPLPNTGGGSSTASSVPSNQGKVNYPARSIATRDPSEAHHSAMQQKQALQHAQSNSFAYYVTQDSSFGNLILPVIPRLPAPE